MNKRPFDRKPKNRQTRQTPFGTAPSKQSPINRMTEDRTLRNSVATETASSPLTFSVGEVANLLQVSQEQLHQWQETFPLDGIEPTSTLTRYTQADLAKLIVVQKLLAAGKNNDQIIEQLLPEQTASTTVGAYLKQSQQAQETSAYNSDHSQPAQGKTDQTAQNSKSTSPVTLPEGSKANLSQPQETETTLQNSVDLQNHDNLQNPGSQTSAESATVQQKEALPNSVIPANEDLQLQAPQPATLSKDLPQQGAILGEMMSTVAQSQQSMLNVQDSIREMLGVIAQDNFNLKHENRKLRERMLELERTLSEHQRREETRKERLEGRLRAVENTLSAIQQQITQLVQLQRRKERRNWFR